MDNYSLGYPSDVPSQIPTRGSPLGSAWGKRMMEGGRHLRRRRHMAKQKPTSSRARMKETETEDKREGKPKD